MFPLRDLLFRSIASPAEDWNCNWKHTLALSESAKTPEWLWSTHVWLTPSFIWIQIQSLHQSSSLRRAQHTERKLCNSTRKEMWCMEMKTSEQVSSGSFSSSRVFWRKKKKAMTLMPRVPNFWSFRFCFHSELMSLMFQRHSCNFSQPPKCS